jgi:transcriptional regulator of heat shock response
VELQKESERKQELSELTNQLNSKSASDQLAHMKNKLETLKKHYTAEQADELERRLLNAIRGQDPAKFTRGIRKIAESKRTKRPLDESQ